MSEGENRTEKPRVVFDTTAVVQAALAPKGPAETQGLSLIDEGIIEAFVSNRLRSEYEHTLNHPDLRARFPHVTEEYIAARLQRFDEKALRLVNPPQYVRFERDPNDEPILNLAIHVHADYIVSADRDLLDLGRSAHFQRLYPYLKVVSPGALRQELFYRQERESGDDETIKPV